MKQWNFSLRGQRQFHGICVMTAIAAVMIAPDLIQDQVPSPQIPALPSMIFSPWTTFCLKGQEPGAKQICITGKEGRVEANPRDDGRPQVDPEVFKAQQQKLQAEAARKKLEEHEKKLRGKEPK